MIKVHQIKLYSTKSQEIFFRKSCGVARFSYNWALTKWQEDYKNGIKQSAYSLIKHLNSIKRTEFPWMQETGKCCSQYAIHNLESAFKKMWKEGHNYPKFKKKGQIDSFIAVENKEQFKQKDHKIWIPRLGWVKCAENLRFNGKVNYVTIKRTADMWFAYVNVEIKEKPIEMPTVRENQAIVGIDMGIKSMMVLSDGTVFENPKALQSNLRRLKRLQRSLYRKQIGSKNRFKQRMKVARLHYRISNIRKTVIHQATSFIVNKFDKIVIEDLNVKGLLKNEKLSQSIGDVSFGEIRRQLAYKSLWQEKELVIANRFFASSKTCSNCGHKKISLILKQRIFKCGNCGLEMDRDLNASKNLAKYSPTSEYEGSEACGEGSSLVEILDSPSTKQELKNRVLNLKF